MHLSLVNRKLINHEPRESLLGFGITGEGVLSAQSMGDAEEVCGGEWGTGDSKEVCAADPPAAGGWMIASLSVGSDLTGTTVCKSLLICQRERARVCVCE